MLVNPELPLLSLHSCNDTGTAEDATLDDGTDKRLEGSENG
jgi:hypothetical protein